MKMEQEYKNLTLLDFPIVKRELTQLRDKNTSPEFFRAAVNRLSIILAIEISKKFKIQEIEVETPLEKTTGYRLSQEIILVPILRAGLGMVNGFLEVIPDAKVGHIGMERNEKTLEPNSYYFKIPSTKANAKIIILDPMLATGGSVIAAISKLKNNGIKDCTFASLVAAPEGIKKLIEKHPDIDLFTTALDRELNAKGYILPGLGDAGDRTFGTL
ncbi:MAG TPA: uracil phosphoribosyltransferase [Ignavibacteriaceae bacterium]|nr:uracil phosphoribosyltransferase [Ignavibacteriaceae bacterium]